MKKKNLKSKEQVEEAGFSFFEYENGLGFFEGVTNE